LMLFSPTKIKGILQCFVVTLKICIWEFNTTDVITARH
jgi:hypothetical protein